MGGVAPYTNTSNQVAGQSGTPNLSSAGINQYGGVGYDSYGPAQTVVPAGSTPPPSGGGNPNPSPSSGGSGLNPHINPATGVWDDNYYQQHGGGGGQPGVDEAAINSVYQPTMNYLNQAEGAVRQDFPNVLDAAQKAYESAIQELSGNKQRNVSTIQNNTVTAGQQKENALSAARRLYDELRRGYQQRFGGASSAGGAASEISNVEQQRQMGQTTQSYSDAMRQIQQQSSQLETDYQTGSMKILESKNQAIAQANRDFQNQLLQIAGQRAQTESEKAAARLDALNNLRNQAYTAQQDALKYQQSLDIFYKQQQADVQTYAQKLQLAGQVSQSAINQFLGNTTTNPTSNLQTGSSGGQNTALTGITTQKKDELLQGYATSSMNPSNLLSKIGYNYNQ
jgi:hypothetical protein